jgi:transposase-like protein
MQNQINPLSDSVKEQILLESDDPKCVITKLATKHGITANRIYNWRSKRNHPGLSAITASNNFIELVANNEETIPNLIEIEYMKTELKFPEFLFSIEGKISTTKLQKIIELVSSSC